MGVCFVFVCMHTHFSVVVWTEVKFQPIMKVFWVMVISKGYLRVKTRFRFVFNIRVGVDENHV